jgi:ribonuclease T2
MDIHMNFLKKQSGAIALQTVASLIFAMLAFPSAAQKPGKPGVFDFYLFTLSWSPQFCSTNGTNPECISGGKSFVVHGLWPEFNSGQWPANCSNEPGLSDPSEASDLLSASMASHEWSKHGTCSGLDPNDYFALMRKAKSSVTIPPSLANATSQLTLTPPDLKASFAASNPGVDVADVVIGCSKGYLVDVELCLNKNGTPINCPAIQDCHSSKITVRPVLSR